MGNRTYPSAFPFHGGVALVWTDLEHIAIIDEAGAFILKPFASRAAIGTKGTTTTIERGDESMVVTRKLAEELARDPSQLAVEPPEPLDTACPEEGVEIVEKDGTITYLDATGRSFIKGAFDYATCFYRDGRAWVAIRDRREWCQIDKRGEVDEATCHCTQPIIAIEFDTSPRVGPDCYRVGLDIVRQFPR